MVGAEFLISLAGPEHAVDEPGQLVRASVDRRGGAQFGAQSANVSAQGRLALQSALGRQAQDVGGAVGRSSRLARQRLASTDAGAGADAQPGSEVLLARPTLHLQADLRQEILRGLDSEPRHLGEIHPRHLFQALTQLFVGLARGGARFGFDWLALRHGWGFALEGSELATDLFLTGQQLELIEVVELQGRLQRKEVLWPVVAFQSLGHRLRAALHPLMLELGQLHRVTLAGHDGPEDRHATRAGNVAQDVVELHVHLLERLLHPVDLGVRIAHQAGAVPQVAAQDADGIGRTEAAAQEPKGVQLLQPLAIGHVGLAPGQVFDVARVDQEHLEAARLQNLEKRNPVHASRLHRDGLNPAGLEPVGQAVQVGREGAKGAHRLRVAVGRHGDKVFFGPDIDAGGVQVDLLQDGLLGSTGRLGFAFGFGRSWH